MERGTRRDLVTCFARVFQSDLKTSGDATRMVYVTSLRRLHRCQVKDERVDVMCCIGPFYPTFAIFIVLCPMSILVFLVFCLII
jgi:hypothetical protein